MRWQPIVLGGVVALGIVYVALNRQQFGLGGAPQEGGDDSRETAEPVPFTGTPASITWQKVDRSADGFRVEMPANLSQMQIPAYKEDGGSEMVDMIFSNPDAETTFSVAWEDDPPVSRANNRAPDRILDMARRGVLARTQTTAVSDTATSVQGFPGWEFSSRNAGGGVMNSRLIYAGNRLYMLNAAYPSATARRDKDVSRFFNSFQINSPTSTAKPPARGAPQS